METSVQAQKASVGSQTRPVPAAGQAFFSTPWAARLSVSLGPPPGGEPPCDPIAQNEINSLINEASQREGLKPDLLRALIEKESGYYPCAISQKGAQGLMQLMPETAEQFGVTDPFDPKQNVSAGARFLHQLLDRYAGDLSLALGAYNAGPTRVDTLGRVPKIAETLQYVSDIQERIKTMQAPKLAVP